jgi:hypothetical protein
VAATLAAISGPVARLLGLAQPKAPERPALPSRPTARRAAAYSALERKTGPGYFTPAAQAITSPAGRAGGVDQFDKGATVQVIDGPHKGKTGRIVGHRQMVLVQIGGDVVEIGAPLLKVIQPAPPKRPGPPKPQRPGLPPYAPV